MANVIAFSLASVLYLGATVSYGTAWNRLGWRGRRAAWLLVAGFAAVLVTFVGVDLVLPGGLHGFIFK